MFFLLIFSQDRSMILFQWNFWLLCFCQSPRLFQPPSLLTLEIFANLSIYCTLPVYYFGQNLPAFPFTPLHPPFYEYLLCCSGSWIYLPKVSSRNSTAKYQICFQLTAIEQCQVIILVSFLLTFNRFHTLCWGFYCWLWTCNCPPGMYGMWNSKPDDFTIHSLFRNYFLLKLVSYGN